MRSLETVITLAKRLAGSAEAWWFDRTRHVSTAAGVPISGLTLAGDAAGCFEYLPSRAATTRLAIRELPIRHHYYTFIDIGSGKGKVLFVAAEYPFQRIEGVEFAEELHLLAQENILRFHSRAQRCKNLLSMNVNAVNYDFPNGNLVLYFFNPFAAPVMDAVLANLEASLNANPREVWLVLAYPELAPVVDRRRRFQPVQQTRRYCIYRTS